MNKLVLNGPQRYDEMFKEAWKKELKKLADKNIFPKYPGTGWLSKMAAKYDLCISIFQHPDGSYAVCGRRLKDYPAKENPWYCSVCYDLIQKMNGEKEFENSDYEDDLPF